MSGEHPYMQAYFLPSHDGLLQLPIFSQRHGGHGPQGFDPSVYLDGSGMGDTGVLGDDDGGSTKDPDWRGGGAILAPMTPNFSLSSSSTEAGCEEETDRFKADRMKQELEEEKKQEKESLEELGGGKFDKANNKSVRKKGEKRQREPRVAFVTKSEVDHLEDGYRWRKYGQKAVKNSPYPRSYYRCTAQKCNVKKRVERSQQDPTTVITSYEGQHTHHQTPANVRSSSYYLVSPPPLRPSVSPYSILLEHYSSSTGGHDQGFANPSMQMHMPSLPPRPLHPQLPGALPDQGLLQDMFLPSFTS